MKEVILYCFIMIAAMPVLTDKTYAQQDSLNDFCISSEEYRLYNLVNEYRNSLNIPVIPLSKSLSQVARQHITDLIINKPDTGSCSFHSWSDKGKWQACCFARASRDKLCMQTKPGELTTYPGKGYEVVYWESREATAAKAIEQWKETSAARSVLTNVLEWEDYDWKALGVGIEGGFAIIWLGEETDPEKEIRTCEGESITNQPLVQTKKKTGPQIITAGTNRFYLIYGNYGSIKEAKEMATKYFNEGFSKASVITKDGKFRISLNDYPSKELAQQGKKELPAKYQDAWIMPYFLSNDTSLR